MTRAEAPTRLTPWAGTSLDGKSKTKREQPRGTLKDRMKNWLEDRAKSQPSLEDQKRSGCPDHRKGGTSKGLAGKDEEEAQVTPVTGQAQGTRGGGKERLPEENDTCPLYIKPAGIQGEVSVSLTSEGIRPPSTLPTEQHRKSETPHHYLVYRQRRRPAQTDWHDSKTAKDKCWREEQ